MLYLGRRQFSFRHRIFVVDVLLYVMSPDHFHHLKWAVQGAFFTLPLHRHCLLKQNSIPIQKRK